MAELKLPIKPNNGLNANREAVTISRDNGNVKPYFGSLSTQNAE